MNQAGRGRKGAVTLALSWALLQSRPAAAQDARLAARLDPTTRSAVLALVDSARLIKLPTEPLVNKSLELAEKGADGGRIVVAVRGLVSEMRSARAALGTKATADEIAAGANALHGGVPSTDLTRLRVAAGKRQLTLPLTVLTDLVAGNVPVPTASNIVVNLTRAGVRDPDLSVFRRNVRIDIDNGADPSTAASTRARGAILHASQGQSAPRLS